MLRLLRTYRPAPSELTAYPDPVIDVDPLEVTGWRMVAGVLRVEELPDIATDALVRGWDRPSLRLLAGQDPADVRDSADLFKRVLDELGIALLPPDEAVWCLVRMTAQEIVDGEIEPASGANAIWMTGYHRVVDSGDLRVFVGLASTADDYPEDLLAIEAEIVAAANELLGRSRPRQWIKLMARLGCSPLSRTVGDGDTEVTVADLPTTPELVSEIESWAAAHEAVLAGWPREAGFESERQAEAFVRRGEQLLARLQAELGDDVVVEYMPEPVRPPGVKLSASHGRGRMDGVPR